MAEIGKWTQNWCEVSGRPSTFSHEMTSTNDIAKKVDLSEEPIHIVVTEHQTAGRGRGSNQWIDKNGGALLASWAFQTGQRPQPVLSPRIGLAVFRALRSTWHLEKLALKAPNDIYLDDKKLAGILVENIETQSQITTIVGLGLNVISPPEEIDSAAAIGQDVDSHQWSEFLERLDLELQMTVFNQRFDRLTPAECELLKHSLNQWTLLKTPVSTVESDGSIAMGDQKVHWRDL